MRLERFVANALNNVHLSAPARSSEPEQGTGPVTHTSTGSHFYTGLKLGSKTHFYGRAAAEDVLAGFLSALLRRHSYL